VVHSHRTALASAAAGPAVYPGLGREDALLVAIGTSFGGWLNVVLPAVAAGARLVFQPRFDPTLFSTALFEERITLAPLVPVMWRAVLGVIGAMGRPETVRLAFMSGEGPGPQDVAGVRALVTDQVRAAYLSTEGGCAAGIVSDQAGPARAIAGAEVRVVEPGGPPDAELPAGEIGELALRAPSIAVGYWRDPDRQRARFVDGWWLTGDLGKIAADGVTLVGRTDHVINSGGVKIHAEEVEQALMRHPMVRQAGVVGVADPVWGQRVEAFVVAEAGAQPEQILDWCRSENALPAVKLPKRLVLVDRLPTGPTGKLYRRALMQADPA
jgi:acyl-CoA synthetase (AMP-forming)/AMP-acid ligase II